MSEVRGHIDPERVALYGGVSGVRLAVPEFQLAPGLMMRETFAHVMAPYLLAFSKPPRPGTAHPPPWKAAQGGVGFDVTVELALSVGAQPTNFDRLNTIWWVLALLRLISGAPIRVPVISDIAFAAIPSSRTEPTLWTIEMAPRQLLLMKGAPGEITVAQLEWVRDTLIPGATLFNDEAFSRAFQTFDSAAWAHSLGSAILMTWAAMEALFRPGRQHITKTLASCIAAFLYPSGPQRDRVYAQIVSLYETRGSAAHDAQVPEIEQLRRSFDLARRSFARCLERREMPDRVALLDKWRHGT